MEFTLSLEFTISIQLHGFIKKSPYLDQNREKTTEEILPDGEKILASGVLRCHGVGTETEQKRPDELDSDKHASLKILSKNAREQDVRRFLEEAKLAKEPGDLQNIDVISVLYGRHEFTTLK